MKLMRATCGLCLAAALAMASPAQAESPKDPLTAGLLGGIVGFGAGYYYTHETTKALIFTGVDAGLVGGILASDEDGIRWGLGAGLLASHIWQGVDGAKAARRDNARHFLPFGVDLSASAFTGFNSSRMNSLYAEGGHSRDLAWALNASSAMQPPLRFGVGFEDRSVGLSYHTNF
jgi:hypothetical protein